MTSFPPTRNRVLISRLYLAVKERNAILASIASNEVRIQKLQSEHVLQGQAEVEIGLDYISPAKGRVSG